jgi:hypothetical protein
MRHLRRSLAALGLYSACAGPDALLRAADEAFAAGSYRRAAQGYDEASARTRSPAVRAQALTQAALACERLGRKDAARLHLEQAISPEVPGASEAALYYLAQLLAAEDRPRALNLYYRAAAGAEANRGRGFPYTEATQEIMRLSLER